MKYQTLILILAINITITQSLYGQIDSERQNKKSSSSNTEEKKTKQTVDFDNAIKNGFNLETCVIFAINNNIRIQIENLNTSLRKLTLKQAKDNILPRVNGNLGYGYNFGRAIDPTSNQFINTSNNFSSAGLTAGVSLFEGFRLKRQIEKSKLSLASSEYLFNYQKDVIALQVTESFLSVILSLELEKNAALKVENDKKNLEKSKQLVNGGTQPKSTEINAKSALLTSQSQYTVAKNNVKLNLLQLKHLMRLSENENLKLLLPEIDDLNTSTYEVDFVYENAVKNQKNIISSKIEEQIADKDIDIATAGYYPTLSLSGSLGTNYSGRRNTSRNIYGESKTTMQQIGIVENTNNAVVTQVTRPEVVSTDPDYSLLEQYSDNFNQGVTLSLSIPIFNNRRTSNSMQRAQILKRQAVLNTQLQEQQLRQNIEKAHQAAIAAMDNYNAADANLTALEEVYRMDQKRLEYGSIDYTVLEISKNNYFTAKNNKAQRKYEMLFKNKVLELYVNPYDFNK